MNSTCVAMRSAGEVAKYPSHCGSPQRHAPLTMPFHHIKSKVYLTLAFLRMLMEYLHPESLRRKSLEDRLWQITLEALTESGPCVPRLHLGKLVGLKKPPALLGRAVD